MLCSEWTLVKTSGGTTTVEPLKCKCWSCELCGPMRSRKLVREAYLGRPNTFLTLTVNPAHFEDPSARARELARSWRLLRLRIMRRYKWKKLPFICVFEKTKKGEPHLHILMRSGYVDQKWISNVMLELMGAPIVDIRTITNPKKLAAYVAKYIGKDPQQFQGTKRYWSSRDYAMADPREDQAEWVKDAQFNVLKCTPEQYVHRLSQQGFWKTEAGPRKWTLKWDPIHWTRDAPKGGRVYWK